MPESLVEIWDMKLMGKVKLLTQNFARGFTQVWPLKFMLVSVLHETLQWFS